jgi:hypothetical protein
MGQKERSSGSSCKRQFWISFKDTLLSTHVQRDLPPNSTSISLTFPIQDLSVSPKSRKIRASYLAYIFVFLPKFPFLHTHANIQPKVLLLVICLLLCVPTIQASLSALPFPLSVSPNSICSAIYYTHTHIQTPYLGFFHSSTLLSSVHRDMHYNAPPYLSRARSDEDKSTTCHI